MLVESEAGYTPYGSASGPVSFEVECLANGDFGPVSRCMPVECGRAHDVSHGTYSGGYRTIVFGENVVYTCNGSYYVNWEGFRRYCLGLSRAVLSVTTSL